MSIETEEILFDFLINVLGENEEIARHKVKHCREVLYLNFWEEILVLIDNIVQYNEEDDYIIKLCDASIELEDFLYHTF